MPAIGIFFTNSDTDFTIFLPGKEQSKKGTDYLYISLPNLTCPTNNGKKESLQGLDL